MLSRKTSPSAKGINVSKYLFDQATHFWNSQVPSLSLYFRMPADISCWRVASHCSWRCLSTSQWSQSPEPCALLLISLLKTPTDAAIWPWIQPLSCSRSVTKLCINQYCSDFNPKLCSRCVFTECAGQIEPHYLWNLFIGLRPKLCNHRHVRWSIYHAGNNDLLLKTKVISFLNSLCLLLA